jgi:hypothetical protein
MTEYDLRPTGATRRNFLARGGVLAAGAGAVSLPFLEGTAAARSSALSGDRRKTYAALVETVGSAPGTLVRRSRGRQATARLAAKYRSASQTDRQHIDQTIDGIASTTAPRAFWAVGVERRLAAIRGALSGRGTAECGPSSAYRVRQGVALAAAAFDRSFRWEPSLADLWIRAQRLRVRATAECP